MVFSSHGVLELLIFGTLFTLTTPAFSGLLGKDESHQHHSSEHNQHDSHHEALPSGHLKDEKHHNREGPPRHKKHRPGIIPSVEEVNRMSTDFLTHHPSVKTVPPTATTTTIVPELFRAALKLRASIDEHATDNLPAETAVRLLEAEVGWEGDHFSKNDQPIQALVDAGGLTPDSNPAERMLENLPQYMDIVIPSIRDLDFLDSWRPFLEGFHLILVQDGDPDKFLKIPEWADYELYNRRDIEAALGDRAWIISQKDASIRNFGFLVSRKKLVYTVDDDCRPAVGPDGKVVDAVKEHARNLLSPSTPFFFNTVYDPYRSGSDFVRGFPYSLRAGVATAVSHGLWLHNYDYDAPTQLLKHDEKNERYVDATLTVPKGVLYPLCSMNVAFDRELIGPAFMQGLMGVGQPWGRYDDMWAGWASKTVADHLGVGSKTGHPYIKHNKASNPFTNLLKEYKGLEWQETVIRFFDTVQLSERTRHDAGEAYVELSWRVHHELGPLNVYFERLGKAMRTWVEVWRQAQKGEVSFVPSRRSGQGPIAVERAAKPPPGYLPPSTDSASALVPKRTIGGGGSSSSSGSGSSSSTPTNTGSGGSSSSSHGGGGGGGDDGKTVTVAFAADGRYLAKVLAVVERLRAMKLGKSYRIIAFDLTSHGSKPYNPALVEALECAAPTLFDEYRRFDFAKYPSHVAQLNCYAWKPLLLAELHKEFPKQGLVWLDSGVTLGGPNGGRDGFLEAALAAAKAQGGVLSDKTARGLEDFTHQGMFEYFEKKWAFPRTFFTENKKLPVYNCNGAFSAWTALEEQQPQRGLSLNGGGRDAASGRHAQGSFVGASAMQMWGECALEKNCMCPPGSGRGNHRQDQAGLTLVLATVGVRCYGDKATSEQPGARGPFGNGTSWVHAHGLKLSRVKCGDDAGCYVKTHAPQCASLL